MKPVPLSIAAAFVLLSSAPAAMLNGNLSWTGNAGYSFKSSFKFDADKDEIHEYYGELDFTESGLIDFRSVVFDPSGKEIFRSYEVQNMRRDYWYMEFHLDVKSKSLIPGQPLDIGDDPGYWMGFDVYGGGMYLNFAGELEIEDEPGEFEYFDYLNIDRGPVSNLSLSVPEGGAGLILTGGCLFGLAAAGGRFKRLRSTGR